MLLFWFMGLGILVFSSLIYYVDDREQFKSIPSGFWWALITMTTVGYGDMYPTTTLGKVVGSCTAMAGVLMIGFTVPALVNNFMLYYRHVQFAMNTEDTDKLSEEGKTTNTVVDKERNGDIVNGKSEKQNHDESYL
ncbi:potassium voltage-gated channel protein Shaw-like [Mercenaria mercenaria]|uniref:potassium voltage-gated channel protein Shaw-like n=1 Tax=Mercenaria mercenaria TaxID=6596 RepID=UPI001E1D2C8F|nr:potassium voltage-gated channel protein Shaw-like [Mercenaria mercenaria]